MRHEKETFDLPALFWPGQTVSSSLDVLSGVLAFLLHNLQDQQEKVGQVSPKNTTKWPERELNLKLKVLNYLTHINTPFPSFASYSSLFRSKLSCPAEDKF